MSTDNVNASGASRVPLRYRCTDPEHRACTGCQPAWRAMLEDAESRLSAVLGVCAQAEHQATRWEDPLPVPPWVERVRAAVGASDDSDTDR